MPPGEGRAAPEAVEVARQQVGLLAGAFQAQVATALLEADGAQPDPGAVALGQGVERRTEAGAALGQQQLQMPGQLLQLAVAGLQGGQLRRQPRVSLRLAEVLAQRLQLGLRLLRRLARLGHAALQLLQAPELPAAVEQDQRQQRHPAELQQAQRRPTVARRLTRLVKVEVLQRCALGHQSCSWRRAAPIAGRNGACCAGGRASNGESAKAWSRLKPWTRTDSC
ncbi:hypothetical protein D3C78_899900 [compost metagenome]